MNRNQIRLIVNLVLLCVVVGLAAYAMKFVLKQKPPTSANSAPYMKSAPVSIQAEDLVVSPEDKAHLFSPTTVKQILDGKKQRVVVVDLRDRDKFVKGHIPLSINIPLDELEVRAEEELPLSDLVVLAYRECDKGNRIALTFRTTLIAWGFQNVAVMDQGVDGWSRASLSLVSNP
jgi:rhodanese-related sulfurtransferase